MIKIASIVSYKILPAVKGGEKGIFFFLKHLGRYAGITCFTVAENRGNTGGIRFEAALGSTSAKWRYVNPCLYFKIKNACRASGIRHVIIEHPYYAWLGYALKKYAGLKLIVHSHNIEAARFKSMSKWWWPVMHRYEKFAHRNADFNFFITEEDKAYAIREYQLNPDKCTVITYGIEQERAPDREEKNHCKTIICNELGLPLNTRLLLFNGTLDYAPNREGLDRILKEINPALLKSTDVPYKIIICGLRLPAAYNGLQTYQNQNIIYRGFVEDIGVYFKAADIFINPVTDGGGIKTKLVEALAADAAAVSFEAGAYGVPLTLTGNNLSIVPDGDSEGFASAIIKKFHTPQEPVPGAFFEHFNWDAIVRKAAEVIRSIH